MATVSSPTPAAPASPPAPGPPTSGRVKDRGSVRHDSVRATDWTSAGVAKVLGDVDVSRADVSGLTSVAGKVRADSFRSQGTLILVGPVDVRGNLELDGTIHLQSSAHAGSARADGALRVAGPLTVDRLFSASGSVEVPSATVGAIDLVGSATIPGVVEAASVRMRFRDNSHLGTVRGNRVVLHGPAANLVPSLVRSVLGHEVSVRVDRVEADTVDLAAVDVEFVHAREIVLGAGAHVTALEGTVVRRHPTSRVGPESRSPRPHGLHR